MGVPITLFFQKHYNNTLAFKESMFANKVEMFINKK